MKYTITRNKINAGQVALIDELEQRLGGEG